MVRGLRRGALEVPVLWQLSVAFCCEEDWFYRAEFRFAWLNRWKCLAEKYDIRMLAFGIGSQEIRLVVRGPALQVEKWNRNWRIGLSRALSERAGRRSIEWGPITSDAGAVENVISMLEWAHSVTAKSGEVAGAGPWSSRWDWIGWRRAAFFTPDPAIVFPVEPPGACPETLSLARLYRVASAAVGVVPGDRRSFGLFVWLCRRFRWKVREIAQALMLTERRIRQLAKEASPVVTWVNPGLC